MDRVHAYPDAGIHTLGRSVSVSIWVEASLQDLGIDPTEPNKKAEQFRNLAPLRGCFGLE